MVDPSSSRTTRWRERRRILLLLVGALASANIASAQKIVKSQLGIVSQQVGNTRIEILYRRPVTRGRRLFGALVPWQAGEHVESLLFAFPMVDADSAVLQLRWGTTVVPLSIRAAPDGTR